MNELFTKEFGSDEEDDEYVPDKKELTEAEKELQKSQQAKTIKPKADDSSDILQSLKAKEAAKKEAESKDKVLNEDEEIQKAIEAMKKRQSEKAKEVINFAGKQYEYEKTVNAKEMEKNKKKETHKELDSLINMISNKKDVSTMDKSKRDWKEYVNKNNIEKELTQNRKDGFLGKKHFLEASNIFMSDKKKKDIRQAKFAYENKTAK